MLGKRLAYIRRSKGMTQEQVAKTLNVKRQTYSAYERDVSSIDADTILNLSNTFKVSADYLLGREAESTISIKNNIRLEDAEIIKSRAENIKGLILNAFDLALNCKSQNEVLVENLFNALEEGMLLAKNELREKYGKN